MGHKLEDKFTHFKPGWWRSTKNRLHSFLEVIIVTVDSADEVISFIYEFFVGSSKMVSSHNIGEQRQVVSFMWSSQST